MLCDASETIFHNAKKTNKKQQLSLSNDKEQKETLSNKLQRITSLVYKDATQTMKLVDLCRSTRGNHKDPI